MRLTHAAAVRPTLLSPVTVRPVRPGSHEGSHWGIHTTVADYGPAPLDAPHTYPGRWPSGPVLVAGTAVVALDDPAKVRGAYRDKTAVVAVGSNACPAQLHRKGLDDDVVLTPVRLRNHLVVYAGHTTSYGAVPSTVMPWPGAACDVFLIWMTDRQHLALDLTEGANYDRVLVPTDMGSRPGYLARTGLTVTPAGQPVRVDTVRAIGDGLPRAMTQQQVTALRLNLTR